MRPRDYEFARAARSPRPVRFCTDRPRGVCYLRHLVFRAAPREGVSEDSPVRDSYDPDRDARPEDEGTRGKGG